MNIAKDTFPILYYVLTFSQHLHNLSLGSEDFYRTQANHLHWLTFSLHDDSLMLLRAWLMWLWLIKIPKIFKPTSISIISINVNIRITRKQRRFLQKYPLDNVNYFWLVIPLNIILKKFEPATKGWSIPLQTEDKQILPPPVCRSGSKAYFSHICLHFRILFSSFSSSMLIYLFKMWKRMLAQKKYYLILDAWSFFVTVPGAESTSFDLSFLFVGSFCDFFSIG